MEKMRLIVAGASGRMGRMLIKAIVANEAASLVGALVSSHSPVLGQDAGVVAGCGVLGVALSDEPLSLLIKADGLIDFSTTETSAKLASLCAQARIVDVIGTTGFSDEEQKKIRAAARHAAIVRSGNMSLGINLLIDAVMKAATALGPEYDIEIVEMHHRHKVDAPSGTALMLAEAAARGRKISLKGNSVRSRDGITNKRPEGAIGFSSIRGGSVIGDHHVIFAGPGERIEFVHRAEDRHLFAAGALRAALWGRRKKPGLYSMIDVLNG